MNIEEHYIKSSDNISDSPYSNSACNDCLELSISLLKHQMQFHPNIHTDSRNEILHLLQCGLTDNNVEFNYNITISVIKIPLTNAKCEPFNLPENSFYDENFTVEWLDEELTTKTEYVDGRNFSEIDQKPSQFTASEQPANHESTVKKQKYKNHKDKPFHAAESKKAEKREQRNLNSDQQKLTCDFCGLTFPAKYLIIKHMREEHIVKNIDRSHFRYKCVDCNAEFSRLMFQRAHVREFHPEQIVTHQKEKEKTSKNLCHVCGKTFIWLSRLVHHRKSHIENRPFQCSVCNKSFAIAANLREHMNTHSGKKYKCLHENCNSEFSHQSGMTRHYKTIHSRLEQYKCEYCAKGFYTMFKLK